MLVGVGCENVCNLILLKNIQVQRRIVNGNETEVNEFPSIVAFIHVPSNYTVCGGTISK